MGIISIILFLYGFLNFFNNRKYLTLISITILASGYFQLAAPNFYIGPLSLQHSDLALLMIFFLIPFRKKLNNYQLKEIRTALLVFFAFLMISILYDLFARGTTPMQIFRTTRKTFYLTFFYLIPSFNQNDYQKLIKFIIYITLIHSLLYISQYIFDYSIIKGNDAFSGLGEKRYRGIPTFLIPVLVLSFFSLHNSIKKIIFISIFLMTVILGQSRGAMISAFSIVLLYLYLQNKIKLRTIITIPILFFFIYYITLSYIPVIGERFSHLFNEMSIVNEMDYNNLDAFYHEGSLIFRWGVTYERLIYVLEDPVKIIFGVGFIPDMDITTSIFTLGTHSPTLPTGFEQYNSVDILFPNIITRYGILGSLIFIFLIIKIFIFSSRNKNKLWGRILFTYLISMAFISLINETFYNGFYFLFIFFFIGLIAMDVQNREHNSTKL